MTTPTGVTGVLAGDAFLAEGLIYITLASDRELHCRISEFYRRQRYRKEDFCN